MKDGAVHEPTDLPVALFGSAGGRLRCYCPAARNKSGWRPAVPKLVAAVCDRLLLAALRSQTVTDRRYMAIHLFGSLKSNAHFQWRPPSVDTAFLLSFVFQQEIQCSDIRNIPKVPSDMMPFPFHFAEGHFNAGLIGVGSNNHLFPFLHDDRVGPALIKRPPNINSLRCRVHRHLRVG